MRHVPNGLPPAANPGFNVAMIRTSILAASALAVATPSPPARPMFRDPVWDGAADASTVYDPARREWRMFYTNRRATLKGGDEKDVAWVHGTAIGVAVSKDGAHWRYGGTAAIPTACTGQTLWAPEIGYYRGQWHMWLTVVPGIFHDWQGPRFIVHLTSRDLRNWTCGERLALGSDRVIDASVAEIAPGRYRLWYDEERSGKTIRSADSTDLVHWTPGPRVVDTPGEGPKAFRWRGQWWLVSDAWKGLLVMRSDDATRWTRQDGYLLAEPCAARTDRAKGQHPDIVVVGDRAFIIYFVHQSGEPEAATDPRWGRRTVLQIAELDYTDGRLAVDRARPVSLPKPKPIG